MPRTLQTLILGHNRGTGHIAHVQQPLVTAASTLDSALGEHAHCHPESPKGGTSCGVCPTLTFLLQDLDTVRCVKTADPHSQAIIGAHILKVPVAFGMS